MNAMALAAHAWQPPCEPATSKFAHRLLMLSVAYSTGVGARLPFGIELSDLELSDLELSDLELSNLDGVLRSGRNFRRNWHHPTKPWRIAITPKRTPLDSAE